MSSALFAASSITQSASHQIIREKIKVFEGYADHFYVDSKGLVTIGIGILVENSAGNPNWDKLNTLSFFNPTTRETASSGEIEADFRLIKTQKASVSKAKSLANLRADPAKLEARFTTEMNLAAEHVRKFLGDLPPMPREVHYALLDMAFNLGGGGLNKYKNFRAALAAGDFVKAASESSRNPKVGSIITRNAYVFDLLLSVSAKNDLYGSELFSTPLNIPLH